MTNLPTVIKGFSEVAGIPEADRFLSIIKEQNKNKRYSIVPFKIDFNNGDIVDNKEEIDKIVSKIEEWAKEEKEVINPNLEDLDNKLSLLNTIREWLSGSRIQMTKPLANLNKRLKEPEDKIAQIRQELMQFKKEVQEKEFQQREEMLKAYSLEELKKVKEEYGIEIPYSHIEPLIKSKREAKGSLTATGSITKNFKDALQKHIDAFIEPILEQKAKEARLQDALNRAEYMARSFMQFDSESIQDIEEKKKGLDNMLNDLEGLFEEEVRGEVERLLRSKLTLLESNLKRLKQVEEANRAKSADEELMNALNAQVKSLSDQKIEDIKITLDILRDGYTKAQLVETREQITRIANNLKDKQKQLQTEAIKKQKQEEDLRKLKEDQEPIKKEVKKQEEAKRYNYSIPLIELEVLASMEFEAENEAEAKKKIEEAFREILELTTLNKKGV